MTSPLNTAIERIEKKLLRYADMPMEKAHNNAINGCLEILRSLLPDEEQFAHDIWDEADGGHLTISVLDFKDYYSQFKPKVNEATHQVPAADR